jgi:predicted AAA+ superfamily ATPase
MIKRDIESKIRELAKNFRVVAITGPRQSGKTTTAKELFANYDYYNLENLDNLRAIEHDEGGFIRQNSNVIIDEVQKLPTLLSYIQTTVDERQENGDYVISGSQNLLLSEKIGQSLAGRAGYATLLPLSIAELRREKLLKKTAWQQIFNGFYPAYYAGSTPNIELFYDNYIQTYVERDLREIKSVQDLSLFRKMLALLAGRIGQVVNYESLSNDVGVSRTTIENWLSILEQSYIIYRLQPFYKNFGKRYIKSAKIYFVDTGLACYLLGIKSAEDVEKHYLRGGLFENMIILDIYKTIINKLINVGIYYFRDSNGNEVDLIVNIGDKQIPIEIKSSSTFSADFTKGIDFWNTLSSEKVQKKTIIYTGKTDYITEELRLYNWTDIAQTIEDTL